MEISKEFKRIICIVAVAVAILNMTVMAGSIAHMIAHGCEEHCTICEMAKNCERETRNLIIIGICYSVIVYNIVEEINRTGEDCNRQNRSLVKDKVRIDS